MLVVPALLLQGAARAVGATPVGWALAGVGLALAAVAVGMVIAAYRLPDDPKA
jgi:hypothetical protein